MDCHWKSNRMVGRNLPTYLLFMKEYFINYCYVLLFQFVSIILSFIWFQNLHSILIINQKCIKLLKKFIFIATSNSRVKLKVITYTSLTGI